MPLVGRNIGAALALHCTHLNRLLATTLTERPLVGVTPENNVGQITFRDAHGVSAVQLQTQFGEIDLFIRQRFVAVTLAHNSVALIPSVYGYTVTPKGDSQPLLRWEFVGDVDDDTHWSRNHLQGPIPVTIGSTTLPLNDWHLPTGWVTLEDVIRFCIVDLGAEYRHRASDWHELLRDSRMATLHELTDAGEL